jgi:AraC family transcriptional regulator, regulatory protein of adaptative response / methylated-DNA-[protein]-cysteine methyltransferase
LIFADYIDNSSICSVSALAVAIPCYRVLRSDGALSGYRWGVKLKRTLLERETRT